MPTCISITTFGGRHVTCVSCIPLAPWPLSTSSASERTHRKSTCRAPSRLTRPDHSSNCLCAMLATFFGDWSHSLACHRNACGSGVLSLASLVSPLIRVAALHWRSKLSWRLPCACPVPSARGSSALACVSQTSVGSWHKLANAAPTSVATRL